MAWGSITLFVRLAALGLLAGFFRSNASDDDAGAGRYSFSGYGSLEAGQIMKGKGKNMVMDLDHIWQQKAIMGCVASAPINERTAITVGIEGKIDFSYIIWGNFGDISGFPTRETRYSFYPTQFEGSYTIGNMKTSGLRLGVGYFPLKYNPDSRNLGEYLFRSYTYPQVIFNEFDFPMARLLGFRSELSLLEGRLVQDLVLSSETKRYPLQDYSVSYLADARPAGMVELGAGVCFDRLFPVNEAYTDVRFMNIVSRDTTDPFGNPAKVTDTTYQDYSYAGTKLMLRCAFDPKKFIPWDGFGENDLRLYAEAAALGLKDYPPYYEKIGNRIPVMVGFNVPALKVLDVLAVEVEWFDTPCPNSFYQVAYFGTPLPATGQYIRQDMFRWSVYARKKAGPMFAFIGQVAHDHLIPTYMKIDNPETYDVLPEPDHWWWIAKTEFSF
jgi:hypothetical protein